MTRGAILEEDRRNILRERHRRLGPRTEIYRRNQPNRDDARAEIHAANLPKSELTDNPFSALLTRAEHGRTAQRSLRYLAELPVLRAVARTLHALFYVLADAHFSSLRALCIVRPISRNGLSLECETSGSRDAVPIASDLPKTGPSLNSEVY